MVVVQELITQTRRCSAGPTRADYTDLLSMLYQLFRLVQQTGVMALEPHFENPKDSTILSKYPKFLARHHAVAFLADSVKVIIVGGMSPHDLESLMDEDLEVHHDEALQPSATLDEDRRRAAGPRHRRGRARRRHHDGRDRRPAGGDRPQGRRRAGRHVPRHPAVVRLRAAAGDRASSSACRTTGATSSASRRACSRSSRASPPAIAVEFARRVCRATCGRRSRRPRSSAAATRGAQKRGGGVADA